MFEKKKLKLTISITISSTISSTVIVVLHNNELRIILPSNFTPCRYLGILGALIRIISH